jgi:diguanylate cyclase (GGDEF)-like protein
MGIPLPGKSRYLYSTGYVHAVRRAAPRASLWTYALLLVVVAYVPAAMRASGGSLANLPWVVAPLLATMAWIRAARRSRSMARAAFWLLAAAPATALVTVTFWLYESGPATGLGTSWAVFTLLGPHVAIAAGTAMAVWNHPERAWRPTLAADALLLLLAASAAVLRLAVEPVLPIEGERAAASLVVLYGVAGIPVLVAALLVLDRGRVLSPRSAVLLLTATALLGAGTASALTGMDIHPLRDGDGFDLVWVAGWLAFAASGLRAREEASTGQAMLARRRTRDTLRKLILPGAALFMAAAVTDIGLGPPPPSMATVLAIATFGVVLSLRTAHALSFVDRDTEHRRQLAHTRALVQVTHSLAGTVDLDTTLQTISESARDVLAAGAAGIELVSDDGKTLVTRSAPGLPESAVGLRFPIEGSFTGWVVRNGRPRATVDPTRDPYIQPRSLDFLQQWPMAAAPIRFRDHTLGALFACMREDPFDAEELELLNAMAEQAAIAIQNARLFERVSELSITDPLTGLANRRQLQSQLAREFAAARRGRYLVAVMFDLDDFKAYNDTHGHLAGDQALEAFGAVLKAETRAMNLAARYGGDEFVVLMAGTRPEGARTFIRRVAELYEDASACLGRGVIHVSAGMACYQSDMENPDTLLQAADADLYRSKPRSRM